MCSEQNKGWSALCKKLMNDYDVDEFKRLVMNW